MKYLVAVFAIWAAGFLRTAAGACGSSESKQFPLRIMTYTDAYAVTADDQTGNFAFSGYSTYYAGGVAFVQMRDAAGKVLWNKNLHFTRSDKQVAETLRFV